MNIQWYPGHMAKSKRLLGDKLKLISVAVIVLDARAPMSTFNPDLESMLKDKACIFVLNKRDLADNDKTFEWEAYFRARYGNALSFSAAKDKPGKLRAAIQQAAAPIVDRYKKKGMRKTIRVLVAGIPNVGKSAIINRLAGRKGAREGDRPGVTRGLQWVRLSDTLELMDTPGLLWPKIEDEAAAVNIALTGCIKPEVVDHPGACDALAGDFGRHRARSGAVALRRGGWLAARDAGKYLQKKRIFDQAGRI